MKVLRRGRRRLSYKNSTIIRISERKAKEQSKRSEEKNELKMKVDSYPKN